MSFNAPYAFQVNAREVIVQHAHNGTLRVSPQNLHLADGGGGTGAFARWKIHLIGAQFCRLQSVKTGKYLRIWRGGNEIDVNGGTGQFTKFRLRRVAPPNGIMLESDAFGGRFIAVTPQRAIKIGSGGPHCKLSVKREGNPPRAKPAVVAAASVASSGGGGGGAFSAPYLFQRNNTVVIRGNHGKHLRLHPHNNLNADGNGGHGSYAQWRVILDGPRVVRLQSTFNQRYLRIEQNGAVNVGGSGGLWTRFRLHVYAPPNGVKLESVQMPGKYVAIRPDGAVCCGAGGIHTQLNFFKQPQSSQAQVKHVCAQPVSKPVRPVVIVQPVPVPVPVVSMVHQQQQQKQMEHAMRQQQQQMETAMQQQQQEMQQQMEHMKLQHEAQQQKLVQQTEVQRAQLEQQVQQQMEEQQEGVVYPVLNASQSKPVTAQHDDDHKQFAEPPPDIAPDDAIFLWLSTIDMQQYYLPFIKNGYDQLPRIASVTSDHLSKMGIALGHQSIILAAATVTAPLMKQSVRLKSVKHGTFVHEYGKPKDHADGKRCWLQHKSVKPGAIWKVELVKGYTLRLRHAPTGSYLRAERHGDPVDTRSPLGPSSDFLLEQAENASSVYYLKEVQNNLYVKCESPRALGRNIVSCTKERDEECKFYLQIVK